ncbi:MAG: NAD(+)/NADH kinase [Clostridia bacterium]|nr:NAD(+)/NADH kinase [Clostridia bacterium]
MKIALLTNYNIGEKSAAAMTVAEKLGKYDCEILIPTSYRDRIERMYRKRPKVRFENIQVIYETAELIIVLGGDGTIMDAASKSTARATPVLGINLGRLGYLAELEMSELDMLDEVMKGNYTIDKRTMLKAEIIGRNGETQAAYALNEAVISNGSIARIIDLQLSEGGKVVNTYRADGLIVCTPTGSTAYSMSAGGPIADPRLNCFCVTPVCPHVMNARPILFPDDVVLEVKHICKREKVLYLTLDGRNNFELYRNDVVKISKSDLYASIVHVKDRSFYEKMRSKLH